MRAVRRPLSTGGNSMVEITKRIQENLKKDSNYYSLYDMKNIERCKVDPDYLGEAMIANENMIWYAIHKYIGKPEVIASNYGIEKDDILQLGRMGFIKAIKAFDTNRGIKFSSFAITAIVREIRCYLRDSANIIRLTRTAHALLNDIRKVENDLGYTPSVEELSMLLYEDEDKISKVLQVGKPVKYLDEQVKDNNNPNWDLEDKSLGNIEDIVVNKVYIDSIIDSIRNKLSEVELNVLKSQLNGFSQTQTAKEQNISQMRVSRIIKKIANLIKGYTDKNED